MSVLVIPPGCPMESASKMLRSNSPWMESPTRRTLPMRSKILGRKERERKERNREKERKRERGKEGKRERKGGKRRRRRENLRRFCGWMRGSLSDTRSGEFCVTLIGITVATVFAHQVL